MIRFRSRKALTIAVAALAVIGGGGAAIAASQGSSSPGQSFLDSVAAHLGISSQKLEDATKAAAIDQVDAALKAGKITQAQADELKARIESGDFPPFFGPLFGPRFGHFQGGPGPHMFGEKLSAAGDYLGLTEAELRTKLNAGRTLAEIAKARGKSVDGLKQAILAEAGKKLDQLVEAGKLTRAEADSMLARLKSHIDDLVDHGMFRFRERFGPSAREHLLVAPAERLDQRTVARNL
jgi:Arc/MetJ-type ribon-helix-helix transcriptional regulator